MGRDRDAAGAPPDPPQGQEAPESPTPSLDPDRPLQDQIPRFVRASDDGTGVRKSKVIEHFPGIFPEIDVQDTLVSLINDGTLFQNLPGKYQILQYGKTL
ncbi:MAG: hypothetical protein HWN66_17405 [Candidatus Helarchaeota archaeon]|nr:hypothetical protein [Candidatus Helarchaeota archaeon]